MTVERLIVIQFLGCFFFLFRFDTLTRHLKEKLFIYPSFSIHHILAKLHIISECSPLMGFLWQIMDKERK